MTQVERERRYESLDRDDTSELPIVQTTPRRFDQDARRYSAEERGAIPPPMPSHSSTHLWLLGGLAAVLVLTLVLGAFYTLTTLNDRNSVIDDLEDEITALSGEKQALNEQVATITAERDAALTKIASLEGDVSDLERRLSQARGDASREQGRANDAETFANVLAQVVVIDNAIHNGVRLVDATLDSMGKNISNGFYNSATRDLERLLSLTDELQRLIDQRDTLMGQLQ